MMTFHWVLLSLYALGSILSYLRLQASFYEIDEDFRPNEVSDGLWKDSDGLPLLCILFSWISFAVLCSNKVEEKERYWFKLRKYRPKRHRPKKREPSELPEIESATKPLSK